MRYRLRTLLLVAAVGPPVLALLYWALPVLPWLAGVIFALILLDATR
jgi:hypothetical protein